MAIFKDESTTPILLIEGCYDCGSTVWGAHTPLCAFRIAENSYLPEHPQTQHWTGERRMLTRREALDQIKRDALRFRKV